MSLSSTLFNRPHFCLQFSAPIDSPRPVFPPPPVERNTLDPSRKTRKYSVLLEKLPQQQCKFSNVQDKHNQKSYERPAAHFSRLPAQLISTNCQWSATGYSSESERSCGPGGRRDGRTTGPVAVAAAIRSDSDSLHAPLHSATRRGAVGVVGGYRGMRFSWLRVIADCHFLVIRKKIFSTPSLAVARIRNRRGADKKPNGARRARAGQGAKLHSRSPPTAVAVASMLLHSMVRQGAPNLWFCHYGANARTKPMASLTYKELSPRSRPTLYLGCKLLTNHVASIAKLGPPMIHRLAKGLPPTLEDGRYT